MADRPCDHNLYHRDKAGLLAGTWTSEATPHGNRISCEECGKFFGYEAKLPPVPNELGTNGATDNVAGVEPSPCLPELNRPATNSQTASCCPGNGANRSQDIYTLETFKQYQQQLRQGPPTACEHRDEFERLLAGKDGFINELCRNSNAQGLQQLALRTGNLGARGQTKPQNAEAVFRSLLRTFALDKSVCYSPFQGETHESAVAKLVRGFTDQDLVEYFAKQDAAAQAAAKAVTNPETLDEFREFVRRRGEDSLSDAQLASFDALQARQTRINRQSNPPIEVKRFMVDELDASDLAILEGYHEKRQCPVYIVQLARRVERTTYDELNRKAKMLGGWYSNFKKDHAGFHFLDRESAKKFLALTRGDVDRTDELADRKERKLHAAIDRLQHLAESVQERAAETIERSTHSLQNTVRQAGIQASVRERARIEKAFAATLQNITDALARGEAEFLASVRHGTQVDLLLGLLTRAKWNHYHAAQKKHGQLPSSDRQDILNRIDERQPCLADVRFAKYPFPSVYRRHLEAAVAACKGRSGMKLIATRMEKHLQAHSAEYLDFTTEYDIDFLRDFVTRATSVRHQFPWIERSLDELGRLRRAGINTLPELRAAFRELIHYRTQPQDDDPVAVLERELVGKKLPGFFPTPRPVIGRMLELARIEPDDRVLEPSCGKGDIAEAIRDEHPNALLFVVELNRTFESILNAKQITPCVFMDFLDFQGEFDCIVMNPPFENGQEMDHVRHAFSLLAPGGTLVAVMSEGPFFRGDTKAVAFREWLESLAPYTEPLPDDAFSGREAFRQTSVRTRLIRLVKPVAACHQADGEVPPSPIISEEERVLPVPQ